MRNTYNVVFLDTHLKISGGKFSPEQKTIWIKGFEVLNELTVAGQSCKIKKRHSYITDVKNPVSILLT